MDLIILKLNVKVSVTFDVTPFCSILPTTGRTINYIEIIENFPIAYL